MKQSIYGLAKTYEQADRIVQDLHNAKIRDDEISIVYADSKKRGARSNKGKEAQNRVPEKREEGVIDTIKGYAEKVTSKISGSDEKSVSSPTLSFEMGTKSAEGAVSGATTGGLIGGTLGLLASLGTISIPGVGPLIAAGPILSTLSGLAVGTLSGGLAGSLAAASIPEYYVTVAKDAIEKGQVLIAVTTDTKEEACAVMNILEKDGATDVSTTVAK